MARGQRSEHDPARQVGYSMFFAKERGPSGKFFDDDDTTRTFEGHQEAEARQFVADQNAYHKSNWADSPDMRDRYDEFGGKWGLIGIKKK